MAWLETQHPESPSDLPLFVSQPDPHTTSQTLTAVSPNDANAPSSADPKVTQSSTESVAGENAEASIIDAVIDTGKAEPTAKAKPPMSEELVLGIVLIGIALFLLVHSLAGHFTGHDIKIERLPSRQFEFKIDINEATEMELVHLPGVGPSLAKRIIEHRDAIQRFESIEQLREVKGIGAKTLEAMRPYLLEVEKEQKDKN